ncbi:MAG: ImmA/IrrE family metallo-endopeptidase [Silvanigrellaceae bacterium]
MKRTDENRYPQSAELFKFCKEALNIKHAYEVKVIDQHVGAILGFDPADCSHWKKGKKNIKSLETVKAIAQHLDVSERNILDIIAGRSDVEEALHEYRGYGNSALSSKQIDDLKREYFKNTSKYQSALGVQGFEELIDLKREATVAYAEELLLRARVDSLPVMVPEIFEVLDGSLKLVEGTLQQANALQVENINGATTLTYRAGDMKPFLRFLIAREIGRHVLIGSHSLPELQPLIDIRLNIFASALLMPSALIKTALRHSDPSCDLVEQLSVLFWVPRSVVSARLKDFIVS